MRIKANVSHVDVTVTDENDNVVLSVSYDNYACDLNIEGCVAAGVEVVKAVLAHGETIKRMA